MTSLSIQSDALQDLVATLGEHYPILNGDMPVTLRPGAPEGVMEVRRVGAAAVIHYGGTAQACRGIGTLLAGIDHCRESTSFQSLGIMLDCSRNAVMKVDHFKGWLRQLALLGYNMAMLYTEDTYELPCESYFGYLRGRYSPDEVVEIDRYAARLGIEMVGCIQTLGHLERILRWPAYRGVKDTASVLMVDEEGTYSLIEKMIARCAEVYGSRRIHIGMDETHDLGRGRFLDLHGYERGYDLFNRHLERVRGICAKHGLQPILWSDMYFRMGSPTQAYDATCRVPEDVKRAIPQDVQLVYWDYYQREQGRYAEMISKHRELGVEPLMASGVWTWNCLWYQRENTEANVPPCVAACREAGVREIFFTMWGDDGAYCEFDSALAGLVFAADQAYASEGHAAERFRAICGADYEVVLAVADMNSNPSPVSLLWDDPLLRVAWKNEKLKSTGIWKETARRYRRIARSLRSRREVAEPVNLAHAAALLAFFIKKIELNMKLDAGEYPGLQVKPVVRALDRLLASFRRQWNRRNKPHGFDTIQIRLGGQKERYAELALRLDELAKGTIAGIPEVEEWPATAVGWMPSSWHDLAASGIL